AGFDGAARRIGTRIEEEDDGLAFEVGEGDRLAILVLEGEIFYFVAELHGLAPCFLYAAGLFGQSGKSLFERGGILDVEGLLVAIDLAHEAGEDFAGAYFNKLGSTVGAEEMDTFHPPDRTRDLTYKTVAGVGTAYDKPGVDVGGDGDSWVIEDNGFQIL